MNKDKKEKDIFQPYVENKEQAPWMRIFLIVLGLVLMMILIFLLLRSCTGNLERELLRAAKAYYADNTEFAPAVPGECTMVTLEQLDNEGLINANRYRPCDVLATYVQVCMLESKDFHYTPVIFCNNENDTSFAAWAVGREQNLIADKSNLRFTFMAEVFSSQERRYYPGDKRDAEEVREHFIASPARGFIHREKEGREASKWYTERQERELWNNGWYSSTPPSGFPDRGREGTPRVRTSTTRPANASYRTITQTTLFRTRTVSGKNGRADDWKYVCLVRGTDTRIEINNECFGRDNCLFDCSDRNPNWVWVSTVFSCDGRNAVPQNTACPASAWSSWTTTRCNTANAATCESRSGWTYTDRIWQWSRTRTVRRYIPSGAANAATEKTFFVDAPVPGAIRDTATTTTAFRFYRLVEGSGSSEGDWNRAGDTYVSEFDLLELFRSLGHEVDSLRAIVAMEEIRYSIRLEYAHRN